MINTNIWSIKSTNTACTDNPTSLILLPSERAAAKPKRYRKKNVMNRNNKHSNNNKPYHSNNQLQADPTPTSASTLFTHLYSTSHPPA